MTICVWEPKASKKKKKGKNCEMVPVTQELNIFVTSEGGFNCALEKTK